MKNIINTTFNLIKSGEENSNPLSQVSEGNNIPVLVENTFTQPRHAELQVRIGDEVRGTLDIVVPPEARVQFHVPVNLEGLRGDTPAEVVFISPDEVLLPLQRAAIWLLGSAAPR